MIITSIKFLIFCLISILLFLVFPPKYRWISLLISSIAFYVYSSKFYLIIFFILTSFTTWLASRMIEKCTIELDEKLSMCEDKAEKKRLKKETQHKRFVVLLVTLIINLGILISLKICNFYADALDYLASLILHREVGNIIRFIMPLGISYYTFSSIGYLLDVYWKRYKSEANFFRFLLFGIYFPHILQGPISRYNLLGQELKKEKLILKWDNFIIGAQSILLGCFKKLVIADRANVFVSSTLSEPELQGEIYLLALILDAIQIYADFSGYMDIVSGLSKMFDIELEKNFNHPFLAKSVPEFWRRWHMSLGSWFKDYVYYPISVSKTVKKIGNKVSAWRSVQLRKAVTVVIPVMITWISTGLWHGTGLGYVMWGFYYGILILCSVTFSEDINKFVAKLHINTQNVFYRILQTIKIFVIFMGGRFLASTMSWNHKINIVKRIIKSFPNGSFLSHGLDLTNFIILGAGILLLIFIAIIEAKESIFDWMHRRNKIVWALIIYVIFFSVFLLGIYGTAYDVV